MQCDVFEHGKQAVRIIVDDLRSGGKMRSDAACCGAVGAVRMRGQRTYPQGIAAHRVAGVFGIKRPTRRGQQQAARAKHKPCGY